MSVLNGKCEICTQPCYRNSEGDTHETCVECAIKIHKEFNPKLTNEELGWQLRECEAYGGDGFPHTSYGATITKIKKDYLHAKRFVEKMDTYYFDCDKSHASLCKNDKEHDPSTMKTYKVKIGEQEELVHLCQHHYDSRLTKGWQPHCQWTLMSTPTSSKIDLLGLKKGQRVQVRIHKDTVWATVLREGYSPILYLDEGRGGSWLPYGEEATYAKSLGLDVKQPRGWHAFSDECKVLQVTDRVETKYHVGDRIKIKHTCPAGACTSVCQNIFTGWAVVLEDSDEPFVFFEDQKPFFGMQSCKTVMLEKVAEELGLDPNASQSRRMDKYIEVLEVQKKKDEPIKESPVVKTDFTDLKQGERVKIDHHGFVSWATVVLPVGTYENVAVENIAVCFDEVMLKPYSSWAAKDAYYSNVATAAKQLELDTSEPTFRILAPGNTKVLEKAPSIKMSDLQKGDRVYVLLNNKHYTWATMLVPSETNSIIHVDTVKGKDGIDYAGHSGAYDTQAEAYGLETGMRYWGVVASNTEFLLKGMPLTPKKPEEKIEEPSEKIEISSLKEGDRIKVEIESGDPIWATVVAHDNGTVVLYLDRESNGSYPRSSEKAACDRLGLNTSLPRFRHLSKVWIKILEKEPPVVKEKPIELSSLEEGDRVEIESDGHITWATVVWKDDSCRTLYYDVPKLKGPYNTWDTTAATTEYGKAAIKYGLDPLKPNFRNAYADEVKVLRKSPVPAKPVPVKTPEVKAPELKISSLKEGERAKIQVGSHTSWATVVIPDGSSAYKDGSSVLVYFDDNKSGGSWKYGEGGERDNEKIKEASDKLGLDITQPHYYYLGDNNTKVLEKVEPIELSDLEVGDRVHVVVGDIQYTWATVVCKKTNPVLHLDNPGAYGWKTEKEDYFYETVKKYGLSTDTKQCWHCMASQVKVLAKGKKLVPKDEVKDDKDIDVSAVIDNGSDNKEVSNKENKEDNMAQTKYKLGEILLVRLLANGKEVEATVIDPKGKAGDDKQPLLYLPNGNKVGWVTSNPDHIRYIKNEYLGNGRAANCYFLAPGDVEVLDRLDVPGWTKEDDEGEQTKEGEENMKDKKKKTYKVGDRIKIHADSSYPFTAWATVVSLKGLEGDSDQPLLYVDEEQDDTGPWEEEWQRKAAIKAGLDPERGCFWWLDSDDTEVLETEDKMEESNFMSTVKSDAVEAGYRVASNQMTKGVKAGLLRMFKDKGADEGKLAVVRELLDSEVGSAVIALLMGHGLGYIPKLNEDPRFQKLAKEFRIGGMSTAGNVLMDTVMQYLAPAVMEAVGNLPPVSEVVTTVSEKAGIKKKTKKRIGSPVRVKAKEETPEQEEEKAEEKKSLTA